MMCNGGRQTELAYEIQLTNREKIAVLDKNTPQLATEARRDFNGRPHGFPAVRRRVDLEQNPAIFGRRKLSHFPPPQISRPPWI